MIVPNTEELNTSGSGDDSHCLDSHELEDFGCATSKSSASNKPEEVPRRIKAATDPLKRQLQWFHELMKELGRASPRRNEETSCLTQGLSRPHGSVFDIKTGAPLNPPSEMIGQTIQMK